MRDRRRTRSQRPKSDRLFVWSLRVYAGVFIAFLVTPLAAIVLFSFNDSPFYSFPLKGLTLGWYRELLHDPRFLTGFWNSLAIAVGTAVLATILGTAFAYGIARQQFRFKTVAVVLGFMPLVTPTLIIGVTFQSFFVLTGFPLSRAAVVIAHTTYAAPLVALVVLTRFLTLGDEFETAARDLGASPTQTMRLITLPLAKTAVQGGLVVALLLSFNEFIIAFHTSAGFFTLPQLIYSMQRVGLNPTLLAYFTLTIVAVVVSLLILEQVIRSSLDQVARRRAQP